MTLIAAALPHMASTTNHYRLNNGTHVLITVPADVQPVPAGLAPILGSIRINRTEPGPTLVFLADPEGQPIDADGDPTNGLTPIRTFPPGTTHEQALAQTEETP
ncbi:MAG: hypothetical protein WBA38_04015 [Gordonia sp. (in: high G+C Gram-positive bacteria)]|uniref:DUF7572 family protein n=1 Tax=Gordonia sp. (in: high G+C Gram-positive bacteria) TaxID=84139 RepID=UPI003C72D8B6